MKNQFQSFLLLFFISIFIVPLTHAQVTIWNEDFTLADDTETDAGATAWSESPNAQGSVDAGSVQGNVFTWEDIDGETSDGNEAIWLSQSIDISNYNTITVSADVRGTNSMEDGEEYIILEYSTNGGTTWTQFTTNGFNDGDFSNTFITASSNVPNNTTLQIRARVFSDNNNEDHELDNVLVQGILNTTNPATCGATPFWDEEFSLPDGTDSDNGSTAWSEAGNTGAGEVNGNAYVWENTGAAEGIWISDPINISGLTDVSISMDIQSDPDMAGEPDYLIIEYTTDGGTTWNEFTTNGNNIGDFGNLTASVNSINGTTLQVRARARSSANGEFHTIDNVQVSCVTNTTGGGGGTDPDCVAPLAPPTFTEIAATTGGLDVGGGKDGGTAWGDFNQDGCLDLLVNTNNGNNNGGGTRLFQSNCDGTFFRVAEPRVPAELEDIVRERSVIWGDINNDGWLDFARNTSATGNNQSSIHFYLNDGNAPNNSFILIQTVCNGSDNGNAGGVVNPAQQNEIDNGRLVDGQNTEGLGWLDYNNDGFLDLVIENHNHGIDILENQFFWGDLADATPNDAVSIINLGGVTCDHPSNPNGNPRTYPPFIHVTPDEDPKGLITGATDGDYLTIGDFNDDGYLDILGRKNNERDLFANNGNNFFPVNLTFNGQANNGNKGGVAFCDFDSDGDFDIIWTSNDNQTNGNENFIWMQTGLYSENFLKLDGTNATTQRNPIDGVLNNVDGCACGDIDNDGDVDLFLSAGNGSSYMFRNDGVDGNGVPILVDNTAAYGINVNANGEGVNLVDYDNDGDLDLYINVNGGDNQLWRNDLQCPKNNLKVEALVCIEPGLYREAVGTTIRIESMDGTFSSALQDVNAAKGHGSQNPLKVPFGIPDNNDLYRIIVRFPPFGVDLDGDGTIESPDNGFGQDEVISETYTVENVRPTDFPDQTVRITSQFAIDGATDCNGGLLPVEMLYFTGEQLISGENLLKWGTAWERDNDKFVIERSFNGTNFEAIGEQKARSENSISVTAYEFLDRDIAQEIQKQLVKKVYYRLRQVDTNGTISFSKVVVITMNTSNLGISNFPLIYPSPNKKSSDFMLDYEAIQSNQEFYLKIYNVIGQIVYQKKYTLKKGTNKLFIPTKKLPKGILIAKWTSLSETNSQKILLE
ncbi:FG-GAP-like repeat-containing protein [Bernardetia sp. ABR2-2B]|uniref:FG-GAP-like repeat-containing protein n=1 Tax=Bernardetia sp. ABR2-2B TaxID=3127472 RepID=UPI0030CC64FB